jgi:hypothetical protein
MRVSGDVTINKVHCYYSIFRIYSKYNFRPKVKDKKENFVKETCRNSKALESQGHGRMTLRQVDTEEKR